MNRASFLLLVLGASCWLGCPAGSKGNATIDLTKSTATVDRSTGVKANGTDIATLTVALIDTSGNPVAGALVQISASGTGNALSAAPLTDASGKTSATLASTVAETKTVTVQVANGSLTSQPTVTFVATQGAPAKLALATQPHSTQSGAIIAPALQVSIQDASGNVVKTSVAPVTVSLVGGTTGATLSGTATVPAVNGVATFGDLSIDKTGTAYTLTFAAAGIAGVQSQPFDVTAGISSKLAFQVQPTTSAAGSPFSPIVQVVVQDASGNVVPGANIPIQLTLHGSGGTLTGTTNATSSSGVATFTGLAIDQAGTGYALDAQSGGYVSATSSKFDITAGAASKLVFAAQPTNAVSGAHIAPAIQVSAQDSFGNVATTDTSPIALSLTTPGGATLFGTTTQNAVTGTASFADLAVDKAGSYTLTATSGALSTVASSSFTVSPGAVTQLAYLQQPSGSTANAAIAPAVKIALEDAAGNAVPGTSSITVALGTNPGGAHLSGTLTQSAATGVATFADLALDKVGNGYTLSASGGALTAVVSAPFNITAGSGSKLVFTQQASNVVSGAAISPAVVVTVEDASGNVVTTSTASITLAFANNPSGGNLGGTSTQAAVAGVATFANLTVDKVGTGYSLSASSPGIASVTGSPFSVSPGAAAKLVFTQEPQSASNGATLASVGVTFEDAAGNVVPSATGQVTLAIATNPGGGTLSGVVQVNAVAGVATFPGLSIDKTGNGYTLSATSGALSVLSTAFNITPGLITGTNIQNFIADQGVSSFPVDMSAATVVVYVPDGGSFQTFNGVGDAGGAFSIAGVPTTNYYFQYKSPPFGINDYVFGSSRAFDLGSYLGGRADVSFATPGTGDAGTYLSVSLTGLKPWGSFDTMEVFSSNAGLWAQNIESAALAVDGGPPALGATTLVETENYSEFSAPFAVPLVDAAKNDQTFLWQLATETPTGGTPGLLYLAAASAAQTQTLTMTAGQVSSISGVMGAVPQSSPLAVKWNLPSFESQIANINPGATFAGHSLFLDAIPTGGHGFYVNTPDLITMGVGQTGLGNQNLGLAYGDIFPSWTKFGLALMQATVPYSVAGINGSVTAVANVMDSDNIGSFPFAALQPQLSPAQSPTINGQNAFNTLIGVGLNPTLAWTAPSVGTANGYVVNIYDLAADSTGNLAGVSVGRIFTPSTGFVVPPGLFLSGHHYIFQITAVSYHGLKVSSAPYQSDFPQNSADCYSGVMTP